MNTALALLRIAKDAQSVRPLQALIKAMDEPRRTTPISSGSR